MSTQEAYLTDLAAKMVAYVPKLLIINFLGRVVMYPDDRAKSTANAIPTRFCTKSSPLYVFHTLLYIYYEI